MVKFDEDDGRDALMAVVDTVLLITLVFEIGVFMDF